MNQGDFESEKHCGGNCALGMLIWEGDGGDSSWESVGKNVSKEVLTCFQGIANASSFLGGRAIGFPAQERNENKKTWGLMKEEFTPCFKRVKPLDDVISGASSDIFSFERVGEI